MQVCTSLQTDNHASTPPLSFFIGWMPFLPPNQQRQSTEGNNNNNIARETSYLFQRISIMLQRFNSVLLHNTLPVDLPDL